MKLYIIALIALAGCCFFIGWDNKPEEQKRMFLVGFTGTTLMGQTFSGGIDMQFEGMLSVDDMREYIREKNNLKSAYVVSLYEFRSKADYNKFWNK
jgi:hypothetical protein